MLILSTEGPQPTYMRRTSITYLHQQNHQPKLYDLGPELLEGIDMQLSNPAAHKETEIEAQVGIALS
jgi:hypothetical protein